jgi:hypothetical protein
LPFVLESLEVNACVQFITELIVIVQIVFAPVISIATVSRLKSLIENHMKRWKELFADHNVTPKQHYMIHLPSHIQSLGPMIRHMCMRFESKHCLFEPGVLKVLTAEGQFRNPKFNFGLPKENKSGGKHRQHPSGDIAPWTSGSEVK